MQQTLTYPAGVAPRRPALVAGLAISVLLHVALLAFVRMPTTAPLPADERRWTQPLTVRLVPPPPPKPVAPERIPPEPQRPAQRSTAPARQRQPAPMRVVPSTPAQPRTDAVPPAVTEAPAAEPRVDINAARAAARGMASDLDAPSGNWAAEKLNKGKEWRETRDEKLGKNVANAARSDCRNAPGGLLAPLIMLMDKKDSGCKW